MLMMRNISKLEIMVILQVNLDDLRIRHILMHSIPKLITVLFYNGSNYDYDLSIKALAKEFERKADCIGEITEKYITPSSSIRKDNKKICKIGK